MVSSVGFEDLLMPEVQLIWLQFHVQCCFQDCCQWMLVVCEAVRWSVVSYFGRLLAAFSFSSFHVTLEKHKGTHLRKKSTSGASCVLVGVLFFKYLNPRVNSLQNTFLFLLLLLCKQLI